MRSDAWLAQTCVRSPFGVQVLAFFFVSNDLGSLRSLADVQLICVAEGIHGQWEPLVERQDAISRLVVPRKSFMLGRRVCCCVPAHKSGLASCGPSFLEAHRAEPCWYVGLRTRSIF